MSVNGVSFNGYSYNATAGGSSNSNANSAEQQAPEVKTNPEVVSNSDSMNDLNVLGQYNLSLISINKPTISGVDAFLAAHPDATIDDYATYMIENGLISQDSVDRIFEDVMSRES